MRYLLERDLLLDRHPIFWIANTTHLWVILGATAVTLAYMRFWIATQRALLVADALIALLMGTITGVAVSYLLWEGVGVPPGMAAWGSMGIIAACVWRRFSGGWSFPPCGCRKMTPPVDVRRSCLYIRDSGGFQPPPRRIPWRSSSAAGMSA